MRKLIYKLSVLTFVLLVFQNCEKNNDSNEEEEMAIENFEGNWSSIFSTFKISDDTYTVKSGYWNENEIYFSIDLNSVVEVKIQDLNIFGTQEIDIVNSPYATIKTTHPNGSLYKTNVRPTFWIDGPNFNNLIYGGEAFYPEYYIANNFQHIVQGGYLTIDSYNSKYISGTCWIVAWVYNSQLNREVLSGIYIDFKGLEYKK